MLKKKKRKLNYTNPDEPRYADLERVEYHGDLPDSLKIVSYNINFARKVDKAIDLLYAHSLDTADIICLQEMDSPGVQKIAEELQYNYVYYPAVLHPRYRKDFGNAILTKWKLLGDRKIILPHLNNKSLQRIAVQASVQIHEHIIMVFCVHMRVILKPEQRQAQMAMLIGSIPPEINHCIVAGDFNTFTKKSRSAVSNPFCDSGFELATKDNNWTYKHWYLLNKKSLLDHIFTKGLNVVESGIIPSRKASDHVPIWVEVTV